LIPKTTQAKAPAANASGSSLGPGYRDAWLTIGWSRRGDPRGSGQPFGSSPHHEKVEKSNWYNLAAQVEDA